MVLATAAGVTWLQRNMEAISSRTAFSRDADHGGPVSLPVPPIIVLPTMTDPTDAAPIYRRAIEQYNADPFVYGKFARSGRANDLPDIPAIKTLVEAAHCAHGNLFAASPSEIVSYNPDKPTLEAVRTLGACARRAGQLIEKNDPDEAMKLYEAAFALGARLYEERLTYEELDAGLTLMAEGSATIRELARAAGDSNRVEACKRFDEARVACVTSQIQPTQRVIGSADQNVIEQYAGDVFYFARHAGDRIWRVEAILKLGRYRFNAGRIGDQRNAMRVLKELLHDPDPVIQTAAAAARDLTEEQYRMLR
jgi:hypothetical protein